MGPNLTTSVATGGQPAPRHDTELSPPRVRVAPRKGRPPSRACWVFSEAMPPPFPAHKKRTKGFVREFERSGVTSRPMWCGLCALDAEPLGERGSRAMMIVSGNVRPPLQPVTAGPTRG
ncbi:MAG: hypothetical protein NVS3B26_04340 [Mycobacteriales bacterium]